MSWSGVGGSGGQCWFYDIFALTKDWLHGPLERKVFILLQADIWFIIDKDIHITARGHTVPS